MPLKNLKSLQPIHTQEGSTVYNWIVTFARMAGFLKDRSPNWKSLLESRKGLDDFTDH